MSLLELEGVETYIGEYHILQGVSFAVRPGAITVLLGRNGAGKTTTLRTIMGLNPARRGRIRYKGKDITRLPPHEVARLGIGYVPEDRGLFGSLTVAENLRVAVRGGDLDRQVRRRGPGAATGRLAEVLELFPDLKRAWNRPAGTLSGGQQQMLAIGRVLLSDNDLLLIDEPSKGLAPVVVEHLGEALRKIAARTTVLLVEQNFGLAQAVAEHCVVIDDGRTVHQGSMADLLDDPVLRQRYLGVA
ncbi:ABC transporter ATP-binding protein [Symbiobacterium thermophilum]|uniref:ABC transporter ATP-binding protein n=1 Tax=Symbiobacterium thermophilum TaxID=2734 RepID=A0A953LE46_SYMTR|nr:ABC transporter ATP-binding protein [Symbiobacterium thermophilum]MBY6276125.1 ABC transporter ATP-binding protein [Symbiobacterium thermophilum]